jgi:hypothetical protein
VGKEGSTFSIQHSTHHVTWTRHFPTLKYLLTTKCLFKNVILKPAAFSPFLITLGRKIINEDCLLKIHGSISIEDGRLYSQPWEPQILLNARCCFVLLPVTWYNW